MKTIEQIKHEIIEFLKLEEPKRIMIIADNDEDGITSSLNISLFLENKGHTIQTAFFDRHLLKEDFASVVKTFAPQKTIFLDLGDDFVSEVLDEIADLTQEFVSIDHHKPAKYPKAKFNYLMVTPEDFSDINPSKYPVAKMVYDLFGGKDWVAAIGVIGDSAKEQWDSFLKEVEKNNDLSSQELFSLMKTINSVRIEYRGRRNELVDYLKQVNNPKEIFDSEFYKLKEEFDQKIERITKDFEENAERFEDIDLVFYFAKEGVINPVINPIAKENKSTTFIFYKTIGGACNASLRRSDFKVSLPKMLKEVLKEIPNSHGGGHVPASGASMPAEYIETFKERVKTYLKENYTKE